MNVILFVSRLINVSDLFKGKILSKLVVCIAVCLLVSSVSSAQTTYYVNQSVVTSGNGKTWGAAFKTLSEAIKVASSSVADEIWVAKGIYIPNTNQYGTVYEPPSFSYNMAFYLKNPVKIYGGFIGTETALSQRNWEDNETILSGNINDPADSTDNIYHVLLILGTEASPLENVTVDGFTISDGYANITTSITLDGNVIYAYNGGGIYNIYASPELKNLKIIRNVGFVGGGIHNKNSSPVIDNCQVLQNYSGSSGGGIYNLNGNPLIQNTLIADNYVNNIGGGGIDNSSSNATIKNSTIRNNRAGKGGGIASDGGNVILENVIIENNTGNTKGGGMYNLSKTNLTMKHVTIRGNEAQYGGGMNTFRAILHIDSSQISNNIADYYGGGIYSDGDSIEIYYSNIDSNKAIKYTGGGIYFDAAFVTIEGGTIKGNTAMQEGAGLRFQKNSHGAIKDVEIIKNSTQRSGGGIYLANNTDPSKQFQFTKVVFSENEAVSGGGIYLNSTSPKFDNVTFTGNNAEYEGGGLTASTAAYPDLSNCNFEKNKADNGGGLYSGSGSSAKLNNVSFLENEAITSGGGIYYGDTGDLNAVKIKGNKATNGGGAYIAGTTNLTNALITGNYVSERGGGIYIYRAAPVLTNNTLAGNNALLGGGGIYAENSGNTKIRNTVIYGNSAGLGFVNGLPKLSYSFVEGRSDVTNGNIAGSVDPQFTESYPYTDAPFITGNYILKATSPVADKGDNSFYQTGSTPDLSAITTDVLGNTRFYNTTVDMGAFEYQPGALPLKLISFEALFKNNAVNVSWQTMVEVNVSHFEIERSSNGISFVKVGVQEADGRGIYDFDDMNLPNGNIYYRLKMVDKDGQSEYSNVKLVKVLNFDTSEIITYPIPSNGQIYITNKNKTPIKGLFSVLTTSGKTIMQTYSNPVDIHSLVPGMYYIKVADATGKLIGTRAIIKY